MEKNGIGQFHRKCSLSKNHKNGNNSRNICATMTKLVSNERAPKVLSFEWSYNEMKNEKNNRIHIDF